MKVTSWKAALVFAASLTAAAPLVAGATIPRQPRTARTSRSPGAKAEPKNGSSKPASSSGQPVELNLMIAGLGRDGCDIEVKPGTRSCKFQPQTQHVGSQGKANLVFRDIEFRGADPELLVRDHGPRGGPGAQDNLSGVSHAPSRRFRPRHGPSIVHLLHDLALEARRPRAFGSDSAVAPGRRSPSSRGPGSAPTDAKRISRRSRQGGIRGDCSSDDLLCAARGSGSLRLPRSCRAMVPEPGVPGPNEFLRFSQRAPGPRSGSLTSSTTSSTASASRAPGTTASTSRLSGSNATWSHQSPCWSSAGSSGSQCSCFLTTNDHFSSNWTSRVLGGKRHQLVVELAGVVAGQPGVADHGVAVHLHQPRGAPWLAAGGAAVGPVECRRPDRDHGPGVPRPAGAGQDRLQPLDPRRGHAALAAGCGDRGGDGTPTPGPGTRRLTRRVRRPAGGMGAGGVGERRRPGGRGRGQAARWLAGGCTGCSATSPAPS